MSNIYVPIDFSDAKNRIPTGEDILYSTLCQVASGSAAYTTKWLSHVLMTEKGLVYTAPISNKFDPLVLYVPWNKIYGIGKARFQRGQIYFKLVFDNKYETEESFKQRCKEFKSIIKPIKEAGKNYWLTNFPTKKERKAELKRLRDIYQWQ